MCADQVNDSGAVKMPDSESTLPEISKSDNI